MLVKEVEQLELHKTIGLVLLMIQEVQGLVL